MRKLDLEEVIGDNMMGGLKRYIDNGIPPGSFLTAVLCNNLKEACGRADDHNRHLLFEYCAYLYNYAPAQCWGSEENFIAWIKTFEPRSKDENRSDDKN